MIELDIAACEHTLRELRDLIVSRDRVQAFNDASMVLLKHFVMHMIAAWHSDDNASIAPVVVPIAFLVANRVVHPKHISAAAMAKATKRLPVSAKVSNDITPAVVTVWVER